MGIPPAVSAVTRELSAYIATAIRKPLPPEVAQQAAGLSTVYRDTEHIEKAFMAGMPTQSGVAAAVMVEHGFTGVEDVFSGDRNFFFTFAPQADQSWLTRGLGKDYEILRCGIKRWSTGGPIQAPLHVLHGLIKQHGIKGEDVQKLVVRMPDKDLVSVNNRDMPNICVQHLLAVMLKEGTTTFKATHDYARMRDPRVLALRARVEAVGDPGLTKAERGVTVAPGSSSKISAYSVEPNSGKLQLLTCIVFACH